MPVDVPVGVSMHQVRIKTADQIRDTLGPDGRIDGMSPPPGVTELGGTVQTSDIAIEHPSVLGRGPKARWYILDGLRWDGSVLGADGPCDRR